MTEGNAIPRPMGLGCIRKIAGQARGNKASRHRSTEASVVVEAPSRFMSSFRNLYFWSWVYIRLNKLLIIGGKTRLKLGM